MSELPISRDATAAAYDAGRRAGLAVAALAVSLVAFLSLLGAEKAILAIVLGVLAMRGGRQVTTARRLGLAAIVIAAAWLVSAGMLLALYLPKLAELLQALERLS